MLFMGDIVSVFFASGVIALVWIFLRTRLILVAQRKFSSPQTLVQQFSAGQESVV